MYVKGNSNKKETFIDSHGIFLPCLFLSLGLGASKILLGALGWVGVGCSSGFMRKGLHGLLQLVKETERRERVSLEILREIGTAGLEGSVLWEEQRGHLAALAFPTVFCSFLNFLLRSPVGI